MPVYPGAATTFGYSSCSTSFSASIWGAQPNPQTPAAARCRPDLRGTLPALGLEGKPPVRPVSRVKTTAANVVAAVVLVFAGFIIAHTGSRATRLCQEEGFSGGGSLSLLPPGTKCTGGEPPMSHVEFDPIFLLITLVLYFVVSVIALLVRSLLAARRTP